MSDRIRGLVAARGYDPNRASAGVDFHAIQRWLSRYMVWIVLALLIIAGCITSPVFATVRNWEAVSESIAVLGLLAVGQTIVLVAGGMDLSVGMLAGLVVVVTNGVMNGRPSMALPAVALGLAIGLAGGLLNGLLIAITRIHPLILTYGMLSAFQGVIFVYTDRTIGSAPSNFRALAYGSVGGVPLSLLLLLVAAGCCAFVLHRTTPGRYAAAIGSAEEHARRLGVRVGSVKVFVYALSGLLAGLAGLVLASRLGTGYTDAGAGIGLNAIVAVILGGTALTGGRGTVLGTLGGTLLLTLIPNVLNLANISSFTQQVIQGLIVIAAVTLYATPRLRQS